MAHSESYIVVRISRSYYLPTKEDGMKKSVLMVLATACLLVLAAHCAHAQEPPLTQKKVYSGSENPFAMKGGDEFVLTLESNPTTGYRWQLAEKPDENIVKLVSSEYKATGTKLVGAGGNDVWTFRAEGKGKTTINLIYVRPWEKDAPPAKTAAVIIIVQ